MTVPPLRPPTASTPDEVSTENIIAYLKQDVYKTHDNLWAPKIAQATQANKHWGEKPAFKVRDFVTQNWQHKFWQKVDGCTAKLMPRYDGKYKVFAAFPKMSVYSIVMPNALLTYTTFHTSKLWPYHENDPSLFPFCELPQLGPNVIVDGEQEWLVKKIIDECCRGRGHQSVLVTT